MKQTLARNLGTSLLFTLLAPALTGCYRSVPVDGGAPSVGREVVLELTGRGALELAPQLGAQLEAVTGRIGDYNNGRYQISVTQTTGRGGIETIWRGESAVIPREYVGRVYERRLDKKRTWIVSAATVIGVVLAGEAFGVNTGLDGLLGGGGKTTKQ